MRYSQISKYKLCTYIWFQDFKKTVNFKTKILWEIVTLDHKRKIFFLMLLNSNHLYHYRKPKSKIFLKNNDSFHLGATPKHFSFICLNSNFPPFLWPLICSYWVWLTNELVNKQNLVWLSSNHMFLRSAVASKHLEEGSLPQMFKNQSPRQKICPNQKNI